MLKCNTCNNIDIKTFNLFCCVKYHTSYRIDPKSKVLVIQLCITNVQFFH